MLQSAERAPAFTILPKPLPPLQAAPRAPEIRSPVRTAPADYDDGLLPAAGPIIAGAYGLALAIAALTFMSNGEALFAVAISAVFGIVYFLMAFLAFSVRKHRDERWHADGPEKQAREVAIWTGIIHRSEALVQMTIVPLAVVAAFSGFALIWIMARPHP